MARYAYSCCSFPRSGETVAVVGARRHAGIAHFIIRQPDLTLALRRAQAVVAAGVDDRGKSTSARKSARRSGRISLSDGVARSTLLAPLQGGESPMHEAMSASDRKPWLDAAPS